jgi:hypothetical protein
VPALIPKTDANITLSVNAPNEIEISEGEYYPNPLEIKAVAGNTGDIAAQNVIAEISFHEGMELVSGSSAVNIGTIVKDAELEVVWQISIEPDDMDRTFTYSVTLSSDNADTQTVERTLFVPAIIPKTDTNITLLVTAPEELEIEEGEYSPNPFEVKAVAGNTGDIAAQNVQAEISLPEGMELVSGTAVVNIGTIEKDALSEAVWQISVEPDNKDRTFAYSVTLTSDNAQTQTVEKELFVPAIEEEKTEAGIELQLRRSRLMDGNTLSMDFKLVNTGTETYDLNKLSVRYYYMDEFPTATKVFNVNNAQFQQPYMDINNAAVSVKNNALEETLSGANAYIEFNFTTNAQLVPGQEAIVDVGMNTPDYKNMVVKNDYSYIGDEPEDTYNYATWEFMPVYLSGEEKPIWGEEPEEGDENAAEASDLLVELDPNNTKSNYNAMSIQMRLTNPGVELVDLGKTEIIYYYTNDRLYTQIANENLKVKPTDGEIDDFEIVIDEMVEVFSVNGTVTYNGNDVKSKTEAKLFLLSEFREMANMGLSITFQEDAGVLGFNDFIDLQISIHKPDYSGLYTQESLEDDFSYLEVTNEDLDIENTPGFRSAGNIQVIVKAEKAREKDEIKAASLLREIREKYSLNTGEAQLNITGNQPARKKWPGNVIKAFAASSDPAPGWIVLFTPDELKESWDKGDEIEFRHFDSFIRKERTLNGDILVEFPNKIYNPKDGASIPVENITKGDLGQLKINFSTDAWLHFERSSITGSMMGYWDLPYPEGVEVDSDLDSFVSGHRPPSQIPPTDTLTAVVPFKLSDDFPTDIDLKAESTDELSDYSKSSYQVWYDDDTDADDEIVKHSEDFDSPYKAIGYISRYRRLEGAFVLKITEGKEDKEIFRFNEKGAPTFYLFAGSTLKGETEVSDFARQFTVNTEATNPHVIRSDGLFAWTDYSQKPTTQTFAHRANIIRSGKPPEVLKRKHGESAEGNTGAYVYRRTVNDTDKLAFRVVEKVDFSEVELTVLNYESEGAEERMVEDDKKGTRRNAYIYISSALNDTGLAEDWVSVDIGLTANRFTKGNWEFFGPSNLGEKYDQPIPIKTVMGDKIAVKPKYSITTNEKGEKDGSGAYTTYFYGDEDDQTNETYWLAYEFKPIETEIENEVQAVFKVFNIHWKIESSLVGGMKSNRDERLTISTDKPGGFINFTSATSFVPENEIADEERYYLDNINSGESLINVAKSEGEVHYRIGDREEKEIFSGTNFGITNNILLNMTDKIRYTLNENSLIVSIVYRKSKAEVDYRLEVAKNKSRFLTESTP